MKNYHFEYESPLGVLTIAIDESAINGLWFNGQKYFCQKHDLSKMEKLPSLVHHPLAHNDNKIPSSHHYEQSEAIQKKIIKWLDLYFSGEQPSFDIKTNPIVGTPYQQAIWKELELIPYGKTVSYLDIANALKQKTEFKTTHPRAVGGAVGKNPISIIIPCHRVIGSSGKLTGFAGGLDTKEKLLKLEGIL